MKEFDLNGITYIQLVRYGTDEWYYALDYPDGDLYEAEEIHAEGLPVKGNYLYLIHYPDGEVIQPIPKAPDVAIGEPVYYDQTISFPTVDFAAGQIHIYRFSCTTRELEEAAVLPLSSVKDCYNLRLHEHPLTLCRQANDNTFDIIWPVQKTFEIGATESFYYRDDNRLFFNIWFEDPDYREETIIRDVGTGEILEQMTGDFHIMPNGELWHLKG